MNKTESQEIASLKKEISEMSRVMREFLQTNQKDFTSLQKQVEAKHVPINLETMILSSIQKAIPDCFNEIFAKSYDSPLKKLIISVVNSHSVNLKKIIGDSFQQVIETEAFKKSIIDAFSHKVARTIISNNDGMLDKVSNVLKQDPIFKSKMTLAVSNVVNECLAGKSL